MLFKQKKTWFFRSLFFLNWVFKSFPVSNQPATFSIGGINVWTSRIHGSKFDFRPWYFQNGALTAKCLHIHSNFLNRKLWTFGENTKSEKVLKITQRMHSNFFNCLREIFLFFVNGKFLENWKMIQIASKKISYIVWRILKTFYAFQFSV